MRLDHWMPAADTLVSERHELRVAVPPSGVYAALWTTDFGGPFASALLGLGLTGRFWTPTGGLTPTHADTFRDGPAAGQAQAAWNFLLLPDDTGGTRLVTETRVRVAADARRSFLMYWTLVRPFSGLLRRLMLRDIRTAALPHLPSV